MVPISEVNNYLIKYKNEYPEELKYVEEKLKSVDNMWDRNIQDENGKNVDITLLLAFEYALSHSRITNGKISFYEMIDRLIEKCDKFRLEDFKEEDYDIVYGKTFDEENAIPVLSRRYLKESRAKGTGAQTFKYINKEGKLSGCSAIFRKKYMKIDGEIKELNGSEFDNLSDLRQTSFHEWNHIMETVILKDDRIPREYESPDGKKYQNYVIQEYYRTPIKKDGEYTLSEPIKIPEEPINISYGLETLEETPERMKIHNQITEGMVELLARNQMLSLGIDESEIDKSKYYEHTEMIKRFVNARDESKGRGQTFADYLRDSTKIKNELEQITVGNKDGLHFIGDYADKVHNRETDINKFFSKMDECLENLENQFGIKLSNQEFETLKNCEIWYSSDITEEEKKEVTELFLNGNQNEDACLYVKEIIDRYIELRNKEKEFFETIPEKLGYRKKEYEKPDMKKYTKEEYENLYKNKSTKELTSVLNGLNKENNPDLNDDGNR